MLTLLSYDWLPVWMGVNDTGDFIGMIFALILCFILYILIGVGICPNSFKSHVWRFLTILFWPLFLILCFLSVPFILLFEFSKTQEEQDRDYWNWYHSLK